MEKGNYELLCLTKGSSNGYLPAASNLGKFQVADYSTGEYDDKVLLYGQNYESIFKTQRKNASSGLKRLSVVKISTKDGTSIHRAFLGSNGLKGNQVALSPNSIRLSHRWYWPRLYAILYACPFSLYFCLNVDTVESASSEA